jgi:hypothetical protein
MSSNNKVEFTTKHHNYYCDVENEALADWDNIIFPITVYHKTNIWLDHISKYLDESTLDYIDKYKLWLNSDMSDDWFYD